MDHHPSMLAGLITHCLFETLGFGSFSRHIQTPELLSRVLEEEGYLNARRLHKLEPLSIPENWATLPPFQQLKSQQREPIHLAETDQFKDPTIVYQLKEELGENILSALMTLPQSMRDALQPKVSGIFANYLHIDAKDITNKAAISGQFTLVKAQDQIANISGTISGEKAAVVLAKDILSETEVTRVSVFGGHLSGYK